MRWLLLLATACSASSPASRGTYSCPSERPVGSLVDYSAPVIEGIVVAPPQMCEHGEAYILVERTSGTRTLTPSGHAGCVPADPSDGSCPVIPPAALLEEVHKELDRRQIQINGIGLGPCGDINGDWDAWHLSAGVTDWKQAATLVEITAEVLARYDVRGHVGASVRGITCAVAL